MRKWENIKMRKCSDCETMQYVNKRKKCVAENVWQVCENTEKVKMRKCENVRNYEL